MLLDVSPTRMELLKLKKKLNLARRGHKLLKDKLDELVRNILIMVKDVASLRNDLNARIHEARQYLLLADSTLPPGTTAAALSVVEEELSIQVGYRQILNIKVPAFSLHNGEKSYRTYGFVQTSSGIDKTLELYEIIVPDLILLAQKEKGIQMLAEEIQRTRRRVNALEYILIPNIEDTIKYISMKLEELERNTKAQLMRIKDVVRAPKAHSSAYPGAGKYPV